MAAEPTIYKFRDAIREISPWWLRQGIALRFLYVCAVMFDTLATMIQEAVKRRFPGWDSYDALALIGEERRIPRGIDEASATYAARLRAWLDAHRFRGGPYSLLEQIRARYAASPFRVRLRYYTGRQFEMAAVDGAITRSDVAWLPDADSLRWARWWLFYDWPDAVVDEGAWGDPGSWGDGGTWGTSLTLDEVADLRLVPRMWNAGHTKGRIVLSEGTTELWGSGGDWGDPGWWGAENYAAIDV